MSSEGMGTPYLVISPWFINSLGDNDGVTDIAPFCDDKGSVYDTRVLNTNAVVQQPYTLANATIQVLGNLLIQAFKDQTSEQDLKTVQRFVDSADTEGLAAR